MDDLKRLKDELRQELLDQMLGDAAANAGLLSAPDSVPVSPAQDQGQALDQAIHDDIPLFPTVQIDESGGITQHSGDLPFQHGDHNHMSVFPMLRMDEAGDIVEVNIDDIPRDTSTYDEDGNDQGYGRYPGHPTS